MLSVRAEKILAAVVDLYSRTGVPVGSSAICEHYHIDASSATIRNDLADLEAKGYLYQPHTSAGRVPTDQGFRYVVGHMMAQKPEGLTRTEQEKLQKELLVLRSERARLARTAAKLLAALSHNVAVSGIVEREEFHDFGLHELLEKARQEDVDDVCRLAQALDMIDERAHVLMKGLQDGESRVLIGAENPLSALSKYAMVIAPFRTEDGERGMIAVIGPKSMHYARNKALVDYVVKLIGTRGEALLVVSAGLLAAGTAYQKFLG